MSKKIKLDRITCVGCGICELACSFNKVGEFGRSRAAIRIFYNEENDMFKRIKSEGVKCDICGECVQWCPTGALTLEVKQKLI